MLDQDDQVENVTEPVEELEDEAEQVVDDENTEAEETESENESEVAETDDDEEEDDEPAGLVVSLGGDDEDDEDQSPVIRSMREKLRDQKKRIKELEAKAEKEADQSVQLGDKPTLESVDYDSDKFEAALLDWNEKKRKIDDEKKAQAEKQEEFNKHYAERFEYYQSAKKSLNARNFDEAEDNVREHLSPQQQGILVANAKKSAIFVYALGKNQEMINELSNSRDDYEYAFKLGEMHANMKVTGMSKKPAPEKRLQGRSQAPANGAKKLEQLRSEAEKTGDYSKVTRYKKELRSQ